MIGVDISEHQGAWGPDRFTVFDFAIVRVANENGYPDRFASQNVAAAQVIPWGVYAWPVAGMGYEWNRYYARGIAAQWRPPLGVWADVERSGRGIAAVEDVEGFCVGVQDTGVLAGFYSNIFELPRSSFLDTLPWWMAHYGPNNGVRHEPVNPSPPRDWAIHQFTSRGGAGGSGLDLNYAPNLDFARQQEEGAEMRGIFVHIQGEPWVWYIVNGVRLAATNPTHIDVMAFIGHAANGRDNIYEWTREQVEAFPEWKPSGGIDLDSLRGMIKSVVREEITEAIKPPRRKRR